MQCPRCGTEYVYCGGLFCYRCKESKDDFNKKLANLKRELINYTRNYETTRRIIADVMKVIKIE